MEELQRNSALKPILQHLAQLQVCACCCLRVAGVRSPEAYGVAAAVAHPSQLLKQSTQPTTQVDNQSPRADEKPQANEQKQQHPAISCSPAKREAAGQKRRRMEDTGQLNFANRESSADAQEEAAKTRSVPSQSDGEADGCEPRQPDGGNKSAPCPLCFGLLPVLATSCQGTAAFRSSVKEETGVEECNGADVTGDYHRSAPSAGNGSSSSSSAVTVQVVLAPPSWRPFSLKQFLGLPEDETDRVGALSLEAGLGWDQVAGKGAIGGEQGLEPAANGTAAEQQAQGGAVPCADLFEAARLLAAEFDFRAAPSSCAAADAAAEPWTAAACDAELAIESALPGGAEPAAESTRGFALELSMPASLAVRAQALWWRLLGTLGADALGAAGIASLSDVVDLKEALKVCASSALRDALVQPSNPSAALRIALCISHPSSASEAAWLAPNGNQQKQGRRKWRGKWSSSAGNQQEQGSGEVVASENLAKKLEAMPRKTFLASSPQCVANLAAPAMSAPEGASGTSAGALVLVSCQRRPLYVGGRYLKLRRGIPQSPWFIGNKRKGESSVEEEIGNVVLPRLRPDGCSFISAGREDFDVRMLGAGRPFVLEVRNARRGPPTPAACRDMQRAINEAASGVEVRNLAVLSAAQVTQLKEGESEKEKSYAAVCWLPRTLSDADVALLDATKDLVIQQKTPIRVLHRRANLRRARTVHTLRVERLPGRSDYFVLHLRAQAGTYIKEFVHGDMGRTRPSLGELLGGCQAQIAYLDVTDIHMAFLERQQDSSDG